MEKPSLGQEKSNVSAPPIANRKTPVALPIAGALVFFLILWRLDFPKPMWDDLFYTGAALNLADGGDFSNPLLARQGFHSHYYLVYPPFHPNAVYGWVSLWGVHAASLVAFQNLMYFIIAACMILILRKHRAPGFLCWLAPMGVTAVFLKSGLRPEAFAVALTMLGYTLLLHCRKLGVGVWISFLLLLAGAGAAPRTAFYSVVLAVVGSWQWRQNIASSFRWPRFFLVGGTAGLVSALIFLVLIGFKPIEFTETFHQHATRLKGSPLGLLHNFMIDFREPMVADFYPDHLRFVRHRAPRHQSSKFVVLCRGGNLHRGQFYGGSRAWIKLVRNVYSSPPGCKPDERLFAHTKSNVGWRSRGLPAVGEQHQDA